MPLEEKSKPSSIKSKSVIKGDTIEHSRILKNTERGKEIFLEASERQPLTTPTNSELRMVGCVHPAAGRQRCCCQGVTGSCRDFTLDRVKFTVVCRGNLEIGLESDTQVGLLAIVKLYDNLIIT